MTGRQIVDVDGFKVRAKATWMAGDYGRVAEFTEATAEDFIARRHIRSGARVLDVACGTGNLAIPAARAGAAVAGIDIAPNLLDQARSRANREEVNVDFQEGDAVDAAVSNRRFRSRCQHVWSHVRAASRHRCARAPPGLPRRRPGRHGELDADWFHRGTFQDHRQTRCPRCRRAQPVAMGRRGHGSRAFGQSYDRCPDDAIDSRAQVSVLGFRYNRVLQAPLWSDPAGLRGALAGGAGRTAAGPGKPLHPSKRRDRRHDNHRGRVSGSRRDAKLKCGAGVLRGSSQARSPRKDRRGRNVMRLRLWMSAIAVVLASGVAVAQTQVVALMPDQVTRGPAPGLPADWRIAVLMGDPAEAGPYVERVKLPPNAVRPTRILTTRTSRCFQVHLVSGRARSLTRPRPGASGGIVLLPARKYGPLRLGWPPRCDCADSWRRPERDQDDPLIRLYGKKAAKSGEPLPPNCDLGGRDLHVRFTSSIRDIEWVARTF